jgi:hypothetical protein
MKEITIPIRRFSITLGDGIEFGADAFRALKDKITREWMGLSWFVQYEDHNELGTAKDIPYIIVDHEYPLSLQDFLSLPSVDEEEINKPPNDPRDAQ